MDRFGPIFTADPQNSSAVVISEFIEDRAHPWAEQSLICSQQVGIGHARDEVTDVSPVITGPFELPERIVG